MAAVEAAAEAFKAWSQTGPGERRALLLKAADALEAKTPQFVEAVAAETGATGMWAGFNVMLAAGMIREAAALTTQIAGEVIPSDVPGSLAMGVRQPAGVVLGIAPWNAPVILGVRAIATPLACGNTVILKGSENCPRTHQLIVEAFQDAGFPPGVVNYITNAPADAGAVVEAMVAHPAVRRVNFTGSTARRQDHRDDLREVPQARRARTRRQGAAGGPRRRRPRRRGQRRRLRLPSPTAARSACRTERIIVDQQDRRRIRRQVREEGQGLPLGDPRKPEPVVLGSVIGMGTVEHCNALIDDALAKGAKLVCGGKADSTLMPATVLDHVTPQMRIYREETFGPVKCIVRVDGVDAAVDCANDNEYGLSAAVFGRDIARALERRAAHRVGHLPRQRPHRARRGADALRRRQGQRHRPLRRQGRHRRVHRTALDHGADDAAALPVLIARAACKCHAAFSHVVVGRQAGVGRRDDVLARAQEDGCMEFQLTQLRQRHAVHGNVEQVGSVVEQVDVRLHLACAPIHRATRCHGRVRLAAGGVFQRAVGAERVAASGRTCWY